MKKKNDIVQIVAILIIPGAIPAILGYNLIKYVQKKLEKGKK